MSFNINSGLFLFDFIDHHAVLGVPVDADFKDIRKRYLQIARRLHPDTCKEASVTEKQQANSLLSKLVNPAYEKFAQESSRTEYMLVLVQMSKHLTTDSAKIQLKSEIAQQLKQSNDIERAYRTYINQLAQKQYHSLEQVLPLIAQISELNLVYLMHKGGRGDLKSPPSIPVQNSSTNKQQPPSSQPDPVSAVEPYLRRAQTLIEKNVYAQARVELQDALKLAPNNSRAHSLIGLVYLKQNQTTMARVHINKALQIAPQDPLATKLKQQLDQPSQTSAAKPTTPTTTAKQSSQPKNGGLFGGIFGGKKK